MASARIAESAKKVQNLLLDSRRLAAPVEELLEQWLALLKLTKKLPVPLTDGKVVRALCQGAAALLKKGSRDHCLQVVNLLCTNAVLLSLVREQVSEGVMEALVPLCQPGDSVLRAFAARAVVLQTCADPDIAPNLVTGGLAGHVGKWLAEGQQTLNQHRNFSSGASAGSDLHQVANLIGALAHVKAASSSLLKSGALGRLLDLYGAADVRAKRAEIELLTLLDAAMKMLVALKDDSRVTIISDKALTLQRARKLISWIGEGSNAARGFAAWTLMYSQAFPGVIALYQRAGAVGPLVTCLRKALEEPDDSEQHPSILLAAAHGLCNVLIADGAPPQAVEAGALEPLQEVVKVESPSTRAAAAECLRLIVKHDPSLVKQLRLQELMTAAVTLFEEECEIDDDNSVHAAGVVYMCVCVSDEALVAAVEAGWIGALKPLLGRQFPRRDRAHVQWQIIQQFAGHDAGRAVLLQEGIPNLLVEHFRPNFHQLETVSHVMATLLNWPEGNASFRKAGAVPALVKMLDAPNFASDIMGVVGYKIISFDICVPHFLSRMVCPAAFPNADMWSDFAPKPPSSLDAPALGAPCGLPVEAESARELVGPGRLQVFVRELRRAPASSGPAPGVREAWLLFLTTCLFACGETRKQALAGGLLKHLQSLLPGTDPERGSRVLWALGAVGTSREGREAICAAGLLPTLEAIAAGPDPGGTAYRMPHLASQVLQRVREAPGDEDGHVCATPGRDGSEPLEADDGEGSPMEGPARDLLPSVSNGAPPLHTNRAVSPPESSTRRARREGCASEDAGGGGSWSGQGEGRRGKKKFGRKCEVCEKSWGTNGQKLWACGGCQAVQYCSKECQAQHWPVHKAACQSSKQTEQSSRSKAERKRRKERAQDSSGERGADSQLCQKEAEQEGGKERGADPGKEAEQIGGKEGEANGGKEAERDSWEEAEVTGRIEAEHNSREGEPGGRKAREHNSGEVAQHEGREQDDEGRNEAEQDRKRNGEVVGDGGNGAGVGSVGEDEVD